MGGNRKPCEEVGTGHRILDDGDQGQSGDHRGGGRWLGTHWKAELMGLANGLDVGIEGDSSQGLSCRRDGRAIRSEVLEADHMLS